jgi:GDP-D-mannose dehydratase
MRGNWGNHSSWVYGPDMKVNGALDTDTGQKVLQIDSSLERAVEVPCLLGDSRLAREVLGWEPAIPFEVSSSLRKSARVLSSLHIDRALPYRHL